MFPVNLKIVTDTPLDDDLFDPEQLKQKDAPPVLID